MFGKNKILQAEIHDGTSLDVQEIFATFQGEGPYAGYPSVFIRLGGCNLACNFCDTEFDLFQNIAIEKIIERVLKLSQNQKKLIVITGGEPFRQPIERLCQELIARGFLVQIETNGTLYREIPQEVKIICSPKISNNKYHAIRPDLFLRLDAFKFIISAHDENYKDIADLTQGRNIPIYLQPMDEYDEEKNRQNIARVLELAQKYNARISLQLHKILKIA